MIAILGLSSTWQWLVILFVALLLFGHRLPGMARSLGSGITEFKRGLGSGEDDDDDEKGDSPKRVKTSSSAHVSTSEAAPSTTRHDPS